jgi:NADH-quinone oxidoreductase subunit G
MAVSMISDLIKNGKKIMGIGSPRASLESNFALQLLVGVENFYSGESSNDRFLIKIVMDIMKQGGVKVPSLSEVEKADAVFIIGEDVTNTAPMLALSVRQSIRVQPSAEATGLKIPAWQDDAVREVVQDKKGPFFIASPYPTRLDDIATRTYHNSSDDVARFGFAVAHFINDKAPAVKGLTKEEEDFAKEVATALLQAKNPLIISGTGTGRKAVLRSASNVLRSLSLAGKNPWAYMCIPECNSMGMALMGSKGLEEAFIDVKKTKADVVIILENDLYRRAFEKDVNEFLSACQNIVVLDYYMHPTAGKAGYILPAGSFAEADGTLINSEGRAQRFFEVYYPGDEIMQSWNWILDMMKATGKDPAHELNTFDDFTALLERTLPQFKGIVSAAPGHNFRINGQKIPRKTLRYSGNTAILSKVNVSEPMPPDDPDSPFSFTMEGYRGDLPSSTIPFFWAPGWNSAQSVNKFQDEVGGHLHGGDPGTIIMTNGHQAEPSFSMDIPETFRRHSTKWFVVAMHHIFGSEELSMLAPGIAERAPQPYLALHEEDAAKINAGKDSMLQFSIDGVTQDKLKLVIHNGILPGTVGVPIGLPGMKWISLPGWAVVSAMTNTSSEMNTSEHA